MMSNDAPLDALSYYRASANRKVDGERLTGDRKCDVAVIGAGFTGLSAALELAEAGYDVAVLEAGPVGWGASGRNGGQICTAYSPGMDKFESVLGRSAAQTCFDIAEEAKRLIIARVDKYRIDCDLAWGYIHAAEKASQARDLAAYADQLAGYGYEGCDLLDKAGLRAHVDSPIYAGGLREAHAGHLHPLNYCLGLAAAAQSAGATLYENTPVRHITEGSPVRLECPSGAIRADNVIIACNGYLNGLVRRLDRRVMPVGSYIIATEPLGENRARQIIAGNEAVANADFVVDYYRFSADHRMLFGGRCSYSGAHPRDLTTSMAPRMRRVFPQLADVRIDYAWGGYIAITYNRLPDAGRIGSNIYYAHGYSGQGVALSGMFGKLMAEAVRGEAERFDIFGRIRHGNFPGGPLRRPALAIGMLYYRLRDLLA